MASNEYQPLYEKIKHYIVQKIHNMEWIQGERIPSEQELAETFGVSRITTKRAIDDLARQGIIVRKKGQGSFVSKPNETGDNNKYIVSILLPYDNTRRELPQYINGVMEVLRKKNYYLDIHCNRSESMRIERGFLSDLPRTGIRGIIYYPTNIDAEVDILMPLYIEGFPIVTVDKYSRIIPFHSVVSENYNGAYAVVSEVIRAGHNKIAFITRKKIETASSLTERFEGYCKALKDHHIPISMDLVLSDYDTMLAGRTKGENFAKKMRHLLNIGITAIFVEADNLIVDTIVDFVRRGLIEPKDFFISGFDGMDIPKWLEFPSMFAIQDSAAIARKAAEVLLSSIENHDVPRQKIMIPVRFAVMNRQQTCD